MADNFTFRVNQKGPTDGGAPTVIAGITRRSFLVVGWTSSAETDNDFAGWVFSIPANWENHLADGITIPVVKPVRNGVVLHVDHYSVYYQDASSFTLGSVANAVDTVATANETATTIDIKALNLTSGSTATFATAMSAFTTIGGQIQDFKGDPRQNSTKGAAGSVQRKSYAQDITWEFLDFLFIMTTTPIANFRQLILKVMKYSIPMTATDNTAGKQIASYDGSFENTAYPANENMNQNFEIPVRFWVEAEVEA